LCEIYDALESASRQPLSAVAGRKLEQAVAAARGQRLWEAFLTEYPELSNSADLSAESPAGIVSDALLHELQAKLEAAGRWPAPTMKMGKVAP
jgi:hypothetical protein